VIAAMSRRPRSRLAQHAIELVANPRFEVRELHEQL
jgi:hypothetical protein